MSHLVAQHARGERGIEIEGIIPYSDGVVSVDVGRRRRSDRVEVPAVRPQKASPGSGRRAPHYYRQAVEVAVVVDVEIGSAEREIGSCGIDGSRDKFAFYPRPSRIAFVYAVITSVVGRSVNVDAAAAIGENGIDRHGIVAHNSVVASERAGIGVEHGIERGARRVRFARETYIYNEIYYRARVACERRFDINFVR